MSKTNHLWAGALAALLLALLLFVAPPARIWAASGLEGSDGTADEAGAAGDNAGESTTLPTLPAGSMYTPEFSIEAAGAILYNAESGITLYEHNADTQLVAASLVKMMTAILTVEYVADIDNTLIVAESWIFDELYGKNASTADIRNGETVSVRELLYAMLLPSANEAALMLGGYIGGNISGADTGIQKFINLMNARAAELGCTGTVFADPNGLNTGNLTTARDMVKITQAFMQHPVLVEIAATDTYEVAQHEKHSAAYNIFTTNRLIVGSSPYYTMHGGIGAAVVAGKTGSLGEWQNFACMAEQNGMTYYAVVLNTPNEADGLAPDLNATPIWRPALYETANLLNWAYTGFEIKATLDTTQAIHSLPVRYSTTDSEVMLVPESDLKTILPVNADGSELELAWSLPDSVDAPVTKGQTVGSVTVSLNGQLIGTSALLAAKDVERNNFKYAVEKFKEFFATPYFKFLLVILVLAVAVYVGFTLYLNSKKSGGQSGRRP